MEPFTRVYYGERNFTSFSEFMEKTFTLRGDSGNVVAVPRGGKKTHVDPEYAIPLFSQ